MNKSKYFFGLILILLNCALITAQIDITDKDQLYQKYVSKPSLKERQDGYLPSPLLDSAQRALSVEEIKASIEYYRKLVSEYHHSQKVFEWQLASSHIVFWMVVILVLSGIVLSWLQFIKPSSQLTDASGNPISSMLKLSVKSGIEVTSPVLGVLILVISLAFFYIYLVEVYQIRILK